MSNRVVLEVPGIFKARPYEWKINPSKDSKSVGVEIGLFVFAQWDPATKSWIEFDDNGTAYTTRGWWYVIGREGKVNQTAVDQLVRSMGWDGDLRKVAGEPPDVVVQATVKENFYEKKKTFKATWMNPEDYIPDFQGAAPEDVNKLQTQFGSLLRAAAAGAKKTTGAPAKAAGPTKSAAPAAKTAAPSRAPSSAGTATAEAPKGAPRAASEPSEGMTPEDQQRFDDDIPFRGALAQD